MDDKTRTLLALAEEVIRDIEDTCDCDAHVEQIKAYRERLAAVREQEGAARAALGVEGPAG